MSDAPELATETDELSMEDFQAKAVLDLIREARDLYVTKHADLVSIESCALSRHDYGHLTLLGESQVNTPTANVVDTFDTLAEYVKTLYANRLLSLEADMVSDSNAYFESMMNIHR